MVYPTLATFEGGHPHTETQGWLRTDLMTTLADTSIPVSLYIYIRRNASTPPQASTAEKQHLTLCKSQNLSENLPTLITTRVSPTPWILPASLQISQVVGGLAPTRRKPDAIYCGVQHFGLRAKQSPKLARPCDHPSSTALASVNSCTQTRSKTLCEPCRPHQHPHLRQAYLTIQTQEYLSNAP